MKQITLKVGPSVHTYHTLKVADDALGPMLDMIGLSPPIPIRVHQMRHSINQLRVVDMPDMATVEQLRDVYDWLRKYAEGEYVTFHTGLVYV